MSTFQESLKKYLDLYSGQETYFVNDARNLDFYKANPSNTKLEDIQQKLSIMNDADFNRLGAQEAERQIVGPLESTLDAIFGRERLASEKRDRILGREHQPHLAVAPVLV